jgi:hypothetical protein
VRKRAELDARTLRAVARHHRQEAKRYDLYATVGSASDATRALWRRCRDEHSIITRHWNLQATALERKRRKPGAK